ncbi:capsid protein [Erysipelotrichaceae bacterium MTC7]|nr:capsid protein [Erysipelotrichaceae bacterium MTC7]
MINYVSQFYNQIMELYGSDLKSVKLFNSNPTIKIINTKDIRLPKIKTSGYKDHTRGSLGFNSGTYENEFETKTLDHDRDIEFVVDPMDVDETNQVLSIGNIQHDFDRRQSIPELDCYTFSKLYSELNRVAPANISTDVITKTNILADFDAVVEKLENDGVPISRCIIYCTSTYKKILKNAEGIQRTLDVSKGNGLDRRVTSMENFDEIVTVPLERFKTAYDFSDGYAVATTGKQINYIIVDPDAQVSRVKYSYIHMFAPGSDSRTADNYLYQNRRFNGTFALDDFLSKACYMNVEA